MHPLTAARPLARAAAALACVLAVVSGLAVAGCARSPAGAGSPLPAPTISRLTVIGGRVAKANGDSGPLWMTAVLTTHAKALTSATPGASSLAPTASGVPGNDAGALRSKCRPRAARSGNADRQVPVHRRGRQDLPGARLRPQPQPAAGLARQPRAGHVSHRSRALTDPAPSLRSVTGLLCARRARTAAMRGSLVSGPVACAAPERMICAATRKTDTADPRRLCL